MYSTPQPSTSMKMASRTAAGKIALVPRAAGFVGAILLPNVRHAIFILVHNEGTEIEVDLLGFQNHP